MRVLVCVHEVGVVALKEMPPCCHLEEFFSFTLNVFFVSLFVLFFFLFVFSRVEWFTLLDTMGRNVAGCLRGHAPFLNPTPPPWTRRSAKSANEINVDLRHRRVPRVQAASPRTVLEPERTGNNWTADFQSLEQPVDGWWCMMSRLEGPLRKESSSSSIPGVFYPTVYTNPFSVHLQYNLLDNVCIYGESLSLPVCVCPYVSAWGRAGWAGFTSVNQWHVQTSGWENCAFAPLLGPSLWKSRELNDLSHNEVRGGLLSVSVFSYADAASPLSIHGQTHCYSERR